MGFHKFRLRHGGSLRKKRAASGSSCLNGGFYKSPSFGATINSLDKLNITWDASCLTPSGDKADIYLYAPSAALPRLHLWQDVTFSSGFYEAEIMPRWWNSTSSVQLQLLVIQSGDAPFMATLPAGPIFSATYSAPSSGSTPAAADTSLSQSDSGITNVASVSTLSSSSRLPGGKLAAAVILPLLLVVGLAAFFWIRRKRAQGKEDRKRWGEKVDQRMSIVSADWQSMSASGASAAIRQSMAIRASMVVEHQDPRSSSYSSVNNLAGMGVAPGGGVGGFYLQGQNDPIAVTSMLNVSAPEMAQLRPGLRSSAFSAAAAATRVSRVSFAADPTIPGRPSGESKRSIYERERPSIDSRRSAYSQNTQSRGSRAFHYDYTTGELPPMPEGAAERASQFLMAGRDSSVYAAFNNSEMRTSHMNVSSSSLGDGSMSRMSRFDEVYGEYGVEEEQEYAEHDAPEGLMSPKQMMGPVALNTEDIQRRISMRRGNKQGSQDSSFNDYDDVGPSLGMTRAQVHEHYTHHNDSCSSISVHNNVITFPNKSYHSGSETFSATSPSSNAPSFPVPSLTGAALPTSPIVEGPGTSSYTGMAPPVAGTSPDDMLRAYAERNKALASESPRVKTSPLSSIRGVTSPLAIRKPLNASEADGEAGRAI